MRRRLLFIGIAPLCLILLSSFFHWKSEKLHARTEKRHFKEQNTRRQHPKGPKRFMVIQKAAHAHIHKHPTNPDLLLITFDHVDPYVTYYKVEPNRNFGILTIKQFMWYCSMGKSMFSDKNPRGAMGHLSFDQDGQTMSFKVFQLNMPQYDKSTNQLTYQISVLPGFDVEDLDIGNVILTIDLSLG